MDLNFLLIFFIARYLVKRLNTKQIYPQWDFRLKWMMYLSLALLVVNITAGKLSYITEIISVIALGAFTYMLYNVRIFKPFRQILLAIAPYMIISLLTILVKYIFPLLFKDWEDILDMLSAFAIVWAIGFWFLTMKQRKDLEKAKEQVEAKEKANQAITQMKSELEVQVQERTAEITKQKEELELALHELKATQSQLIQSEKMASLGELTAGIAHEIQNPLNFVNNFSEVNKELVEELKMRNEKLNIDDAEVNDLLHDIEQNLEKINHHGKRADAIVKGMLLHSRKNTGQKEATDINALCDEYVRLSYHGLRAKDKSFNADFKMEFDDTINKINIVPQDIGRVLLNLFNNAFYAVNEKKKVAANTYQPSVKVSTKKINKTIEIRVEDNGDGIPQDILEKIFQPFFTTKPTGQGTGLGLSLSYDIVKAHGGEIRVETKENEGTTFAVLLPAV